MLPFLWLLVLGVVIYDGWIFYSRRQSAQQAAQQRAEKEAAEARRTLDLIGGLRILNLYAVPAAVPRGKSARLCYSVVGAKTVRMQPEVGGIYPALSHCVEIFPKQATDYTLVAQDEGGHSVSAKITVPVLPRTQTGAGK